MKIYFIKKPDFGKYNTLKCIVPTGIVWGWQVEPSANWCFPNNLFQKVNLFLK